ncbi:MAG TPA: methyltransferase domain-containing protein [Burkholderiales bacterium]|nr:methyltransferase domain-containing protein [Burkholderiales bacterium]
MDAVRIERVYSAYSRVYDRVFGKVFQDSRVVLAAAIDARPGQRVLEVGVGTGLLLPLYAGRCSVSGIDLSEGMLAKARERVEELDLPGVTLERMDAGAMNFADDSFDTAVAAYVVTAVPDHRAVMNEMVRVVRPGGRILLLNHFVNGSPALAVCERAVSPICVHLGFRTDLSVDQVLDDLPLTVIRDKRVKPLGMWHLVDCRNDKQTRRAV